MPTKLSLVGIVSWAFFIGGVMVTKKKTISKKSKATKASKVVVIEINGGQASVSRCPKGVVVEIIDWNLAKTDANGMIKAKELHKRLLGK